MVTDEEIEAALHLSAERQFDASLALYQAILARAEHPLVRLKILFGIVTCSTWLRLDGIRDAAIRELKQLPDFDVSQAFIVLARARASIEFGQSQEALDLIDANLESEILQRDGFKDWKYEHLFLKGRSLEDLQRWDKALCAFDDARAMDSEGPLEAEMLIERANCYLALDRYAEAYEVASQVQVHGDAEFTTLAMQYMAECRMWQRRVDEAMTIYRELQKRLPCRLVNEERVMTGIRNGMAFLEKRHPHWKPF